MTTPVPNTGWFQLAKENGYVFTNATTGDMLVRTNNSNQSILMGPYLDGQPSTITLSGHANHSKFQGDVEIHGNITAIESGNVIRVIGALFENSNITAHQLTCDTVNAVSISNQVFIGDIGEFATQVTAQSLISSTFATSNANITQLAMVNQLTASNIATVMISASCNITGANISTQNLMASNSYAIASSNSNVYAVNCVIDTLSNALQYTSILSNNSLATINADIQNANMTTLHCGDAVISTLSAPSANISVLENYQIHAHQISAAYISGEIGLMEVSLSTPLIDNQNLNTQIANILDTANVAVLNNNTAYMSNAYIVDKIGVNTTVPEEQLHIEQGRLRVCLDGGDAQVKVANRTTGASEIVFHNGGEGFFNRAKIGLDLGSNRGAYIWLNEDRVNIQPYTGNVGIGTRTPQAKLDVNGAIAISGVQLVDSSLNMNIADLTACNVTASALNTRSGPITAGNLNVGTILCSNIDTQNHAIETGLSGIAAAQYKFNSFGGVIYMSNADFVATSSNVGFQAKRVLANAALMMGTMTQQNSNLGIIAHSNMFTASNYAFAQSNDGNTFVNAAPGRNIRFSIGGGSAGSGQQMVINSNGNVGIHTPTPLYDLDVNGTIALSGSPFADCNKRLFASNISATSVFITSNVPTSDPRNTGGFYVTTDRANGMEYQTANNVTFLTDQTKGQFVWKTVNPTFSTADFGSPLMTLTTAGKLGIGTTAPSQALAVVGNAYITNYVGIGAGTSNPIAAVHAEGYKPMYLVPRNPAGQESAIQIVAPFSMTRANANYSNNAAVRTDFPATVGNWNALSVTSACNQVVWIDQSGNAYYASNVGLGVYNATAKLDVRGTVRIITDNAAGLDIKSSNSNLASSVAPYASVMGKRSDTANAGAFSGTYAASHHYTNGVLAPEMYLGRVAFGGNSGDGTESNVLYAAAMYGISECNFATSNTMGSAITFRTGSNGVSLMNSNSEIGIERMRITNTGDVGINVVHPVEKLEVGGNAKFNYRTIFGSSMYNMTNSSADIGSNANTNAPYWLNFLRLANESWSNNTFTVEMDAVLGSQCNMSRAEIVLQNAGQIAGANASAFKWSTRFMGESPSITLNSLEIFALALTTPTSDRKYDVFVRVAAGMKAQFNIDTKVAGTGALVVPTPTVLYGDPCTSTTYVPGSYQSFMATNYTYVSDAGYLGVSSTNQKGPLQVESTDENPAMKTGNMPAGGSYVSSASSAGTTTPAWYAFNRSGQAQGWIASIAASATAGQWLQLQFPTSVICQRYAVKNGTTMAANPVNWLIQGSSDQVNWYTVDSKTSVTWTTTNQTQFFEVQSDTYFQLYRIYVTAVDTGGTPVEIRELRFFTTVPRFVVSANGNVGVSTMFPQYRLQVEGDAAIHGKTIIHDGVDGGAGRGLWMWQRNDNTWTIYMASSGANKAADSNSATTGLTFGGLSLRARVPATQTNGYILENSSNNLLFSVRGGDGTSYFAGNVGIKTAPATGVNLHVGATGTGTTGAIVRVDGSFATPTYTTHGRVNVNDTNTGMGAGYNSATATDSLYMFRGAQNDFRILRTSNGVTDLSSSNWVHDMVITGAGRVGMGGIVTPTAALHVGGCNGIAGANFTQYSDRSTFENGLALLVSSAGGSACNEQFWGGLQMPDQGAARSRTNVAGHYLIGRGNTLAERRMTFTIPDHQAAYSGTGTSPLFTFSTSSTSIAGESNLMTIRASDGYVGIGTTNPTYKHFIKDGNQGLTQAYFSEWGMNTSKELTAARIGYQWADGCNYLDVSGGGSNISTRRVRVLADGGTEFTGPVTIGTQNRAQNTLSFRGTINHTTPAYTEGPYTFLAERVYSASAAELLIAKIGYTEGSAVGTGPDRIRYLSANHVFQITTAAMAFADSASASSNTANVFDALTIRNNGFVGLSNATPLDRLHVSGGGITSDSNLLLTPHAGNKMIYGIMYRFSGASGGTNWYRIGKFTAASTVTFAFHVRGYLHNGSDYLHFNSHVFSINGLTSLNAWTDFTGTYLLPSIDFVIIGNSGQTGAVLYLKVSNGTGTGSGGTVMCDVFTDEFAAGNTATLYKNEVAIVGTSWTDTSPLGTIVTNNLDILTVPTATYSHSIFTSYPKTVNNPSSGRRGVGTAGTAGTMPLGMLDIMDVHALEYMIPDRALTSNTLTIVNGYPINGIHTTSASTNNATAWQAFDLNSGTNWTSAANYNASSGLLVGGSAATSTATVGYAGEWIQIAIPYAAVLTRYQVQGNATTVHLMGSQSQSQDSSIWEWIETRTSIINNTLTTFIPTSGTRKFNFYRVVVAAIGVGSTAAQMALLQLFGNPEAHFTVNGSYLGIGLPQGLSNVSNPLLVYANSNISPDSNGITVFNPNNSSSQHAWLMLRTGGASAGNPMTSYDVLGKNAGWSMGIDNQDANKFKIGATYSNLNLDTRITLSRANFVGILTSNPSVPMHIVNNKSFVGWQQQIEQTQAAPTGAHVYMQNSDGTGIEIQSGTTGNLAALTVKNSRENVFTVSNLGQVTIYEATGTAAAATTATLTFAHGNATGQQSIVFKNTNNAAISYGLIAYQDNNIAYYTGLAGNSNSALIVGACNNTAALTGDQLVLKSMYANIYDAGRHYYTSNGFLGIWTSNPTVPMHIVNTRAVSVYTGWMGIIEQVQGQTSTYVNMMHTDGRGLEIQSANTNSIAALTVKNSRENVFTVSNLGQVTIYEATGTAATVSTATLTFAHGNATGQQSIVFKNTNNAAISYGLIAYQDNNIAYYTGLAGNSNSALIIGACNNTAALTGDQLVLKSMYANIYDAGRHYYTSNGFLGIWTSNPTVPLHIVNTRAISVYTGWMKVVEQVQGQTSTYVNMMHTDGRGLEIQSANTNSIAALTVKNSRENVFTVSNLGQVTIYEATGTAATVSAATLTFAHGNATGQQSIVFKNTNNAAISYGLIAYQDNNIAYYTGLTGNSNSALIIGACNNTAALTGDQLVLKSMYANIYDAGRHYYTSNGFLGIWTSNPTVPMHIVNTRAVSVYTGWMGIVEQVQGQTGTYVNMMHTDGRGLEIQSANTNSIAALTVKNSRENVFTVSNLGQVTIYEATGTAAASTAATLTIAHGNTGGTSSIVFRSANAVGADFGYIQYQDNNTSYFAQAGTSNSAMWIGASNQSSVNGGDQVIIRGMFANIYDAGRHYFASGFIGIANSNPAAPLDIVDTTGVPFIVTSYWATNATEGAALFGRRSRGTAAAPSAVLANDYLTGIRAVGYATSAFSGAVGSISFYASQNFATSTTGTYLTLSTTAINSTTVSERMRIQDSGFVGINTTAPACWLQVTGTANAEAFRVSDGTTSVSWAPGSRFGVSAVGWSTLDPNGGSGTTGIGVQDAMAISGSMTVGASYNATTAPANGLTVEGNMGIGTSAPGYKLDVNGIGRFTGQLYLSDGTATAPALAWPTDTGTGLFHPVNNIIAFTTNQTEQMRLLANGSLGIGTTTPGYKLEVKGDVYANGGWLRVQGVQGLYWETQGAGLNMIAVNDWIRTYGTTLGIYSATALYASGYVRSDTSFNMGGLVVIDSSRNLTNIGTITATGNVSGAIFNSTTYQINGTNVVDGLRNLINIGTITATGNISGAIFNSTTYQINGTNVVDGSRNLTNIGTITASGNISGAVFNSTTYQINGTNVVDGSRNLTNIGTITATANISGAVFNSTTYQINGTNVVDGVRNLINIGTITATGTISCRAINTNGNSIAMGAGNLTCATIVASGDITAFSDYRLKTDIMKIQNSLTKILTLSGYTFKRIDCEKSKQYSGLIAQEVEKVLPEVVVENNEGYKSIAYGNMMGLMVEAMKELNARVDSLALALDGANQVIQSLMRSQGEKP